MAVMRGGISRLLVFTLLATAAIDRLRSRRTWCGAGGRRRRADQPLRAGRAVSPRRRAVRHRLRPGRPEHGPRQYRSVRHPRRRCGDCGLDDDRPPDGRRVGWSPIPWERSSDCGDIELERRRRPAPTPRPSRRRRPDDRGLPQGRVRTEVASSSTSSARSSRPTGQRAVALSLPRRAQTDPRHAQGPRHAGRTESRPHGFRSPLASRTMLSHWRSTSPWPGLGAMASSASSPPGNAASGRVRAQRRPWGPDPCRGRRSSRSTPDGFDLYAKHGRARRRRHDGLVHGRVRRGLGRRSRSSRRFRPGCATPARNHHRSIAGGTIAVPLPARTDCPPRWSFR